jgi:hypothetical protein
MAYKDFSRKDFLKQKRMYFDGHFYTCEDIIKYVANKLGGAHLDFLYGLARPFCSPSLAHSSAFHPTTK